MANHFCPIINSHYSQNHRGCLKKREFCRIELLHIGFPPYYGQPLFENVFWPNGKCFLRLNGIKCSQVISIGKFGLTASSFRYDFWAETGLLRGSELGPKFITNIGCSGAIFYHKHDLGEGCATKLDEFSEKFQTAFDDPPHFRKIMLQIVYDSYGCIFKEVWWPDSMHAHDFQR